MLRPSGPVAFFVVMPDYEAHAGTPVEVRDARGDHDLVFGADEEGEILRTLAPGIFSAGGGAGPITSTYGQFVSILYEALIIGAVYQTQEGKLFKLLIQVFKQF